MQIFISYAAADREWFEKLKTDIHQRGIDVWTDTPNAELRWSERIEQAARAADASILLLAPQARPDEKQNRTWQAALWAFWQDSSKRLIPFLLGEVEVPGFARGTALDNGGYLKVIRARDPQQDWERAVNSLVALLRNEGDMSQVEQVPAVTEADREAYRRFDAYLSAEIEQQKALLPSPAEWRARASHY